MDCSFLYDPAAHTPYTYTLLPDAKTGYISFITKAWAKHLVATADSKITVQGLDNVPTDKAFCLIANHSSNFDIPLLISSITRRDKNQNSSSLRLSQNRS